MRVDKKIYSMREIAGIRVGVTGQTMQSGKHSIMTRVEPVVYADFLIYCSLYYAKSIEQAITKQRFSNKWPALSFRYLAYKKYNNLSLKIWEATGYLKNNISIYRNGKYIVIGFKNIRYPSSGVKVNSIARAIEFGTDKMPARPLFRLVTQYMRKHTRLLFNKYTKEAKGKLLYLNREEE